MMFQINNEKAAQVHNFTLKDQLPINSEDSPDKIKGHTFYKYIWSKIRFGISKNVTEYEVAARYLQSKFDVACYLTALRKNEAIASLFLNESQLIALNFNMKKNIKVIATELEKQVFSSYDAILNYFQVKHATKHLTETDNAILNMMDDDFKGQIIGNAQIYNL